MNCQYNKYKKNYIYFNITCLFLSIYVIFYPLFSKLLNSIFPNFSKCMYKSLTGKNCPFCGGTRYIENISSIFIDITYIFNVFGIIIICVFIEFIFRLFVIIKYKKIKNFKFIVLLDIIWHGILIFLLILYEIMYFVVN